VAGCVTATHRCGWVWNRYSQVWLGVEPLLTAVAGCGTAVRADGGRERAQQMRLRARGRVPGPSSELVTLKNRKQTTEDADSNGLNELGGVSLVYADTNK